MQNTYNRQAAHVSGRQSYRYEICNSKCSYASHTYKPIKATPTQSRYPAPDKPTLSIRTPDGQIQQSHFSLSTYPFEHARIYSKPCPLLFSPFLLLFSPFLLLFSPFLLLFFPFILSSSHLFSPHRCCSYSNPHYSYIHTNKRENANHIHTNKRYRVFPPMLNMKNTILSANVLHSLTTVLLDMKTLLLDIKTLVVILIVVVAICFILLTGQIVTQVYAFRFPVTRKNKKSQQDLEQQYLQGGQVVQEGARLLELLERLERQAPGP